MNKIKQAFHYKLGDLSKNKERVWENMNKPKKRPIMPIALSLVITFIVLGFGIYLMNSNSEQVTGSNPNHSNGETPIVENKDGNTMEIYSQQVVTSTAQLNEFNSTIGIVDSQEKYDYILQLFPSATKEDIHFNEQMLLIAQFGSNGCGLVVESLALENTKLNVELLLPPELRSQKDIMCTEQLLLNTEFLVIDKVAITEVVFIETNNEIEGSIVPIEIPVTNNLSIPTNVKEISVEDHMQQKTFTITNETDLLYIVNRFNYATALAGIRDMIDHSYSLTFTFTDGSSRTFYVWHPYESFIIAESDKTEFAYSIPTFIRDQINNIFMNEMYK